MGSISENETDQRWNLLSGDFFKPSGTYSFTKTFTGTQVVFKGIEFMSVAVLHSDIKIRFC